MYTEVWFTRLYAVYRNRCFVYMCKCVVSSQHQGSHVRTEESADSLCNTALQSLRQAELRNNCKIKSGYANATGVLAGEWSYIMWCTCCCTNELVKINMRVLTGFL